MKISENQRKIVYEMRFAWPPLPPPMNENESVNDFDIYPPPPTPWWTNEHNERRG